VVFLALWLSSSLFRGGVAEGSEGSDVPVGSPVVPPVGSDVCVCVGPGRVAETEEGFGGVWLDGNEPSDGLHITGPADAGPEPPYPDRTISGV